MRNTLGLIVFICSAASARAQNTWKSEQTRRGDTTIVRTISGRVLADTLRLIPELAIGSEDGGDAYLFGRINSFDVDRSGNLFVLDRQAFEVREFSRDGKHMRTFGRKGGGPGEFEQPQNLHVLADQRVLVRDQNRFNIFSPTGTFITGWMYATGFSTDASFYVTADQRIISPSFFDGRLLLQKVDGTPIDTIRPPQRITPAPTLDIRSGGGRASYGIPYMPSTSWTVSVDGKFVSARTDRYEIDVPRANGTVMRIVRDVQPVPVPPAEADRLKEQLVRSIKRNNDPNFEWNGPPIPKTKPLIRSISIGTDSTIWVFRPAPSVERKLTDPDAIKQSGYSTEWITATVADVFDPQGRYLGAVKFPDSTVAYPPPVLSMTNVWAVANHADGYQQVVRYRIQR